jgi:Zn-dependent protease with chaperone function
MPLVILFGAPTPLSVRLLAAVVFGVVFYLAFMFSRHGLYLSKAGVTVWRTVFPRKLIPWTEVEEFRLVCKKVDLGRKDMERVAVVTRAGDVIECRDMNRYVDFESHLTPVDSEKAKLRTFPALIDQLNRIAREANPT